ncbi:MAG: hypothetical protein WCF68_18540 [Terriglobales bacterium]
MKRYINIVLALASLFANAQTSSNKNQGPPLVVGPVSLNCIAKPCAAASITGNARGSGINGPATAQTGMTINIAKDNWWTGGKVGEVDGLDVLVRQNGPHSDSSGILIDVQNQGRGFLSATEFSTTIVDPVKNVLTYGIDVQEGVLDHLNGDYIGAVYSAEFGALGTGVLIQNSPGSSWQYALQYDKDGNSLFSVDGLGNIVGSSLYVGGAQLNGDPSNGSVDIGNLANSSATPYIDLNGFGTATNNVRMINDANGQLTINTVTGGNLQVNADGVYTTGSFHVNLATPASSSAPCTAGQIGADAKYIYVCVAANQWKRSALSSF